MATRKSPRKPKFLKYPKKPRQSAATSVLERYMERVKEIDRENKERLSKYERDLKDFENDKRHHAELIKHIGSIGKSSERVHHRHHVRRHPSKRRAVGKVTRKHSRKRATHRRRRK